MTWLADLIFGRRVQKETAAYLYRLRIAAQTATRKNAGAMIEKLNAASPARVTLGTTDWGEMLSVPIEELLRAHGLITGGTGAGKTSFALIILDALIRSAAAFGSFGIVDPKGDLFAGCLLLLGRRLEELTTHDPAAARELRRRIVIYDFASSDPVSSYNILARWKGVEADFFASNRAELLLDLLSGADNLSLSGAAVLQKLILLLSEFDLPITYVEEILSDAAMLQSVIARSKDRGLASYFARQFPTTPKPTLMAVGRRISALFASEGVRLSLAGPTAPDFKRFQDESRIVLVNCFGTSISRGVRRVLQSLVLSDIRQSVFTRQRPERPFLWVLDEAQNFFVSEGLRENISDLLTMSRSFGTHCLFMTQNLSTAVPDARMLKSLYTNLRWSFSMRGEPSDTAFLKPVLPITERRARPRTNPFETAAFYTAIEERALVADEIAALPDRTGYLWLRSHSAEAVRMRTADLALPHGKDLETATARIKRDPGIGCRLCRKVYDRLIAERDSARVEAPIEEVTSDFSEAFTTAYQKTRRSDVV